jgi:gliding motility-associated-like protein
VKVEPEGTGKVMLDYSLLPTLPWTGQVLGDNHTDFKAIANNEWKFSHWTTMVHPISPNDKMEEMWLDIQTSDEIVAHFVIREHHFYMPNSFTPNGDGVNDIFRPMGNEWNPNYFRMQIFNRQGEKVFETTDVQRGWDGSEAAGEFYSQIEVYVYRVEVMNAINSETEVYNGHVTVIR